VVEAAVQAVVEAEALGLEGTAGTAAEVGAADFALTSARSLERTEVVTAARSVVWKDGQEARGRFAHCHSGVEDENEVCHLCVAGHVSCAHGPLFCPY